MFCFHLLGLCCRLLLLRLFRGDKVIRAEMWPPFFSFQHRWHNILLSTLRNIPCQNNEWLTLWPLDPTWILHSASTSCSLVWASSSSISLSWFFRASFSSSVSSAPPADAVVTAARTRPSLLKRLLHFSQPSTFAYIWGGGRNKQKR